MVLYYHLYILVLVLVSLSLLHMMHHHHWQDQQGDSLQQHHLIHQGYLVLQILGHLENKFLLHHHLLILYKMDEDNLLVWEKMHSDFQFFLFEVHFRLRHQQVHQHHHHRQLQYTNQLRLYMMIRCIPVHQLSLIHI